MWMCARDVEQGLRDRPKIALIYCYDRSKIRTNLSKSAISPLKSEPQLKT